MTEEGLGDNKSVIKVSQISHEKWPTIYQFPILTKNDTV